MARYQECFELDTCDVELIEQSLRNQIAQLSSKSDGHSLSSTARAEVRHLNRLLGKIHNQKVFYSQVSAVGVPAG